MSHDLHVAVVLFAASVIVPILVIASWHREDRKGRNPMIWHDDEGDNR